MDLDSLVHCSPEYGSLFIGQWHEFAGQSSPKCKSTNALIFAVKCCYLICWCDQAFKCNMDMESGWMVQEL